MLGQAHAAGQWVCGGEHSKLKQCMARDVAANAVTAEEQASYRPALPPLPAPPHERRYCCASS